MYLSVVMRILRSMYKRPCVSSCAHMTVLPRLAYTTEDTRGPSGVQLRPDHNIQQMLNVLPGVRQLIRVLLQIELIVLAFIRFPLLTPTLSRSATYSRW